MIINAQDLDLMMIENLKLHQILKTIFLNYTF